MPSRVDRRESERPDLEILLGKGAVLNQRRARMLYTGVTKEPVRIAVLKMVAVDTDRLSRRTAVEKGLFRVRFQTPLIERHASVMLVPRFDQSVGDPRGDRVGADRDLKRGKATPTLPFPANIDLEGDFSAG